LEAPGTKVALLYSTILAETVNCFYLGKVQCEEKSLTVCTVTLLMFDDRIGKGLEMPPPPDEC